MSAIPPRHTESEPRICNAIACTWDDSQCTRHCKPGVASVFDCNRIRLIFGEVRVEAHLSMHRVRRLRTHNSTALIEHSDAMSFLHGQQWTVSNPRATCEGGPCPRPARCYTRTKASSSPTGQNARQGRAQIR